MKNSWIISIVILLCCKVGFTQNYLGLEGNGIYGDVYYPAVPYFSPGIEAGIVFQRDKFFRSDKFRLHSSLSFLKRRNNSGQGMLSQLVPKIAVGYRCGKQKVSFEAVGGFYSKLLVQYDNFYRDVDVDSKFFTIGTYLQPQLNLQISKGLTISFFTAARFDLSPTYVYWLSIPFNRRMYSLLGGVQIVFTLNGPAENEK